MTCPVWSRAEGFDWKKPVVTHGKKIQKSNPWWFPVVHFSHKTSRTLQFWVMNKVPRFESNLRRLVFWPVRETLVSQPTAAQISFDLGWRRSSIDGCPERAFGSGNYGGVGGLGFFHWARGDWLDGLVLEREREYIICWKESKSENFQQKTNFHLGWSFCVFLGLFLLYFVSVNSILPSRTRWSLVLGVGCYGMFPYHGSSQCVFRWIAMGCSGIWSWFFVTHHICIKICI